MRSTKGRSAHGDGSSGHGCCTPQDPRDSDLWSPEVLFCQLKVANGRTAASMARMAVRGPRLLSHPLCEL